MKDKRWPIGWDARWIWAAPAIKPASPISASPNPPPESWNRFCYLRKTIDLLGAPESAPTRVTADSRFILYVNGIEVGRGPARSIPARLAWSEIDLAPFLRAGRNAICALARFYGMAVPWWIPAPANYQLGFGSFAIEAPAIGLKSDGSWKAMAAPYRQQAFWRSALGQPPTEIVDGAAAPEGWTRSDFDDAGWQAAIELRSGTLAPNRGEIPVEPFTAPEPADIAPLTSLAIELTEIARPQVAASSADFPQDAFPRRGASAKDSVETALTFDAGKITLATPWAEVRGPRGAVIDFYVGEDLRDDMLAEIAPRFYGMRYSIGGRERERIEAFEAVGFRYLTVVPRNGAQILSIGATERRYPRSGDARFECDDLRLNKIWNVGARTLDLCSSDAFLDCPGREQRAWLGDSYIHALLTFVTNTDWALVARHLRICAHGVRGDGLLGMVAAGDMTFSATTIPDYSLHWIRALARYYQYSGDRDLVRELAPVASGISDAFERYRGDDGLIRRMPGWMFVDWAMTERSDVVGAVDALYAAALDDFAWLAETALADSRAAAEARSKAARTHAAFGLLWNELAGAYVDAADRNGPLRRISQQTNAIAIVSRCAPADRWQRMLECVLDSSRVVITPTISDQPTAYMLQRMDPAEYGDFDPERNVVAAQPFFSHLLHDAIVRAGRRDLIVERCLKWWPQIERGDTCFEEYWDANSGTGSRCHAWSATPTYDLTTHVLGVRPAAPGYSSAEIAPWFGPLRHLEGAVPTPKGMITVTLDRDRGGEIAIPAGIAALVRFDDAKLAGAQLGPGHHRILPLT